MVSSILTMLWLYPLIILFICECERFQDSFKPIFVKPQEMTTRINNSPYFERMNDVDLVARGVTSKERYKQMYMRGLLSWTKDEMYELASHTYVVDKMIQGTRLSRVPWKFAKMSQHIENGYPHTIEDVIVLPANFLDNSGDARYDSMRQTLVHEKIHVFQRIFPRETREFLVALKFTPAHLPASYQKVRRNNPDLQGTFQKNNIVAVQVYTTATPSSIAESRVVYLDADNGIQIDSSTSPNPHNYPRYIHQAEHPYEVMASIIPRVIYDKGENDEYYIKSKEWALRYL